MRKVGIITFHRALSYGAVLQTYALQYVLNKCNIENEIIDYRCDYINDHYVKVFPKNQGIKYSIKSILMGNRKKRWWRKQSEFRNNYLNMSKMLLKRELYFLDGNYTAVITGSDQVFSPTCAGFDKAFFLDFLKSTKKYSYAASFGVDTLPEKYREEYKQLLESFEKISVREESGREIVSNLVETDCIRNIDPTFLLDVNEWDEICAEPIINEPYILMFSVNKPIEMIDFSKELSKKTGLPVKYLQNWRLPKTKGIDYIGPVTPNEFISLIKNAEYVITNSFHGLAFSIIYKRKFIVETKTSSGVNNRALELLKELNLEQCILSNEFEIEKIKKIDWSRAMSVIENEKNRAIDYLEMIQ